MFFHCILHNLCIGFPKKVGTISKKFAEKTKEEIG